jgi:hypothetical protein
MKQFDTVFTEAYPTTPVVTPTAESHIEHSLM